MIQRKRSLMFLLALKNLGLKDALNGFYADVINPLYETFTLQERILTWLSVASLVLSFFKSPKWFWFSLGLILGGKALKRHATPENWHNYVKPSAKKGLLFLLEKYL
jgi:hypothetical protein